VGLQEPPAAVEPEPLPAASAIVAPQPLADVASGSVTGSVTSSVTGSVDQGVKAPTRARGANSVVPLPKRIGGRPPAPAPEKEPEKKEEDYERGEGKHQIDWAGLQSLGCFVVLGSVSRSVRPCGFESVPGGARR
jgi:hypothetical protein